MREIVVTLLIPAVVAVAAGPARASLGGPDGPQIKVDGVDARDPRNWRAFLSAVDEEGSPVSLVDTGVRLFLEKATGSGGGSPDWDFQPGGLPRSGFRGRLKAVTEATVSQAAIFVMAAHAEIPQSVADLAGTLLEGLAKGLRKDARVGVLVYQDHLWGSRGMPGGAWLGDLNHDPSCLDLLRSAADPFSSLPPEGECGSLLLGPESLKGIAIPAPQGMFPRLFGLEEDSEVLDAARRRGQTPLDAREAAGGRTGFASGAVQGALRWLALGTPSTSRRVVVLISDGRDGYLRVADLAADRKSPRCLARTEACRSNRKEDFDPERASRSCSIGMMRCLLPRVSEEMRRREGEVMGRIEALVRTARALGVQVHALALPGTDEVGRARLRVLALRTGGTFREAATLPALDLAVGEIAATLSRQAVLEPRKRLEDGLSYRLRATWDGGTSRDYAFQAGPRQAAWRRPWDGARKLALGRLGHDWGPPILWVATGLTVVLALLLVWSLGKGVVAIAKKVAKPHKPKVPATPKMPAMKRPSR